MRVALISDIHGNEIALEAVLDDIERAGVDRVVCLGDVATLGPRPAAVIERLRALACPCILGNHDDFLLRPALIHGYTEATVVIEAVDWCRERLSADHFEFLRTFLASMEVPLGGGKTLLAYHGSPRSNMEDLLAVTAPHVLDRMLDGRRPQVMAGGHTHVQLLRQHRGTVVVNPGSVGLPFAEPAAGRPPTILALAEYAIVSATHGDVHVDLRRLALDPQALHDAAAASDNPVAAYQMAQYARALG